MNTQLPMRTFFPVNPVDKDQKEQLIKKIKSVRKYKGFTQSQMSDHLKISQNAYSKIELGVTKLSMKHLSQIAEIFGLDTVKLLTLDTKELGSHLINTDYFPEKKM
ncbi:hypothetical protein ASE74_04550 [Pedobacter sp. Leaf216]|uniref:helix-turn-helix domain-containing protein n=1 Tax=Pedobacter sp. Leaf216 TaxID=1735684 RepID=UPI0006FAA202|nr:helix-turn-helix transcriptional regulator [Pedobacter sp. Leaf216]KQM69288.1 hypothetical protein ASE74_04550 [Pedobacter sp. Leaf216]